MPPPLGLKFKYPANLSFEDKKIEKMMNRDTKSSPPTSNINPSSLAADKRVMKHNQAPTSILSTSDANTTSSLWDHNLMNNTQTHSSPVFTPKAKTPFSLGDKRVMKHNQAPTFTLSTSDANTTSSLWDHNLMNNTQTHSSPVFTPKAKTPFSLGDKRVMKHNQAPTSTTGFINKNENSNGAQPIHFEKLKDLKMKMPPLAIIIDHHESFQTILQLPEDMREQIVCDIVKGLHDEYSASGFPSNLKIAWEAFNIEVDNKSFVMIPLLVTFDENFKIQELPFRLHLDYKDVHIFTAVIDFGTRPEEKFCTFFPRNEDYEYDPVTDKIDKKNPIQKKEVQVLEGSNQDVKDHSQGPFSETKSELKRKVLAGQTKRVHLKRKIDDTIGKCNTLHQSNENRWNENKNLSLQIEALDNDIETLHENIKRVKVTTPEKRHVTNNNEARPALGDITRT